MLASGPEDFVRSFAIGIIIGRLDASARIRLVPYSGESMVIGNMTHCFHFFSVLFHIVFFSYQGNHIAICLFLPEPLFKHKHELRSDTFKDSFFSFSFHCFMGYNFPPLIFRGISI